MEGTCGGKGMSGELPDQLELVRKSLLSENEIVFVVRCRTSDLSEPGFSLIMWYIKVLISERSRIPNFPVPIWSFLMHNDHFAPIPSVYIDVESLELDHRFF